MAIIWNFGIMRIQHEIITHSRNKKGDKLDTREQVNIFHVIGPSCTDGVALWFYHFIDTQMHRLLLSHLFLCIFVSHAWGPVKIDIWKREHVYKKHWNDVKPMACNEIATTITREHSHYKHASNLNENGSLAETLGHVTKPNGTEWKWHQFLLVHVVVKIK